MAVDSPPPIDPTRPFRLLVAENEFEFELLLATLVRDGLPLAAHRVETQGELRAALERDWDAVIAAHRLPELPAMEALRIVRSRRPALPFLVVSGSGGEESAVSAMRSGADDYLVEGRLARLAPALLNAMAIAHARRDREQALHALERSERRLRELYAHLESVVDEERARIARDVHDDIGGALTTLRFDLSWIERNGDPASAERARCALRTLVGVMQSAQRIQRNLRPPVLDAGLVDAMHWQVGEFRRSTGIDAVFEHNVDTLELDETRAMTVYRVLQESLTNVARHAQANAVRIDLLVGAEELSLEIADDGVGLSAKALEKAGSFGLRGLAERARRAGGWIDASRTERGSCVLLSMPLRATAATSAAASSGGRPHEASAEPETAQ
ncbi:MAG: histidine kinase [Burkholderiaceae bacterium]|nr:histidine kinase [Burkholderiaceae bacterium]